MIQVPLISNGHVFHQYCIRVKSDLRDSLKQHLKDHKIGSEVYYPIPIHKQIAYERYNHQFFPNSEKAAEEILALPVHPSITNENIQRITNTINQWTKKQQFSNTQQNNETGNSQ